MAPCSNYAPASLQALVDERIRQADKDVSALGIEFNDLIEAVNDYENRPRGRRHLRRNPPIRLMRSFCYLIPPMKTPVIERMADMAERRWLKLFREFQKAAHSDEE
jgi:hypothetical protein